MNAAELHTLVEPIREAMIADGVWPKRGQAASLACFVSENKKFYDWGWDTNASFPKAATPLDAANAITVALLDWLLSASMQHPEMWTESAEGSIDRTRITGSLGWDMFDVNGPTALHALVAAYKHVKGIK